MLFRSVKGKLKKKLSLPAEVLPCTPDTEHYNVLNKEEINRIYETVCRQVNNREEVARFLLNHEGWRSGMMELHKEKLRCLQDRFERHLFFDLPLPEASEENFLATHNYNRLARDLQHRKAAALNKAFTRLAANPKAHIRDIAAALVPDNELAPGS